MTLPKVPSAMSPVTMYSPSLEAGNSVDLSLISQRRQRCRCRTRSCGSRIKRWCTEKRNGARSWPMDVGGYVYSRGPVPRLYNPTAPLHRVPTSSRSRALGRGRIWIWAWCCIMVDASQTSSVARSWHSPLRCQRSLHSRIYSTRCSDEPMI